MKKINTVLACILMITMVSACSADKENETAADIEMDTEEEMAAAFADNRDVIKQSSGQIGFGYIDAPDEGYVYDGSEVRFRYYIVNMGDEGEENAQVGLMFFVDGEVQPCTIEGGKSTFHFFELAPDERKEFEVSFQPVSGNAGQNIGVIPAVIWSPKAMPGSAEHVTFGNCYRLTANVPLPIRMDADGTGEHQASPASYEILDIPEEVLLSLEGSYGSDVYDYLDGTVEFEIATEGGPVLYADNGKLDVTLNLYGGKQVTDKITLFIGNEPVTIDGGDYITVDTQKDKMCQIKTTIDVSALEEDSVLYAIVMTAGEDYLVQDIYSTAPVLVHIEK